MSKQRFHLNDKGPAICRAKSDESCPLGAKTGDFTHYESKAQAQLAYEKRLSDELGGSNSLKRSPKVHEIDTDPFSLVTDPPYLESGTLLRTPDGTLVLISENMSGSEYGAYHIGNRISDPRIAAELHRLDPEKHFQEGECDEISFGLLEAHPDIVAVDEILNEHGELWHSIARHKDGYYIDSLGKWDEQDLLDYWATVGEREDEGEFTLNRDAHKKGSKLSFAISGDNYQQTLDYLVKLIDQ